MAKKTQEKRALTALGEMEVGDRLWFPASRLGSLKSMCSAFGFQWNKSFSTTINRSTRGFYVTRTR